MNAQGILSRTCLALAVVSSAVTWASFARAQGPVASHDEQNSEATDRIRELFRKGVAAFKAKNYEEARATLLQAWAVRPTPDVAAMLGQTELKLGRNRDAAEHLDHCLRNMVAAESDEFVRKVRNGFDKAKAQIGTVHVVVDRDGAEIRLDGNVVGTSPLKQMLFVEPGEHLVEARLEGLKGSDPVNVDAGKEFSAEIALGNKKPEPASVPVKAVQPPGSPPAATSTTIPQTFDPNGTPPTGSIPSDARSGRSSVPVIVSSAIFAVGLGTGIGFRLAASSKYDKAQSLSNNNGPYGCSGVTTSDCSTQHDYTSKVDTYRNVSTAGFVVAGLAAVAVPVYWFWPRGSASSTARTSKPLQLQSSLNTQGAAIWLKGDF